MFWTLLTLEFLQSLDPGNLKSGLQRHTSKLELFVLVRPTLFPITYQVGGPKTKLPFLLRVSSSTTPSTAPTPSSSPVSPPTSPPPKTAPGVSCAPFFPSPFAHTDQLIIHALLQSGPGVVSRPLCARISSLP